jgi:hypothetical protein
MEQIINDFINTICDLKKEPKKRPIGFVTDEDDPFFDSSIAKLLKRLGQRYPRIKLQCSNCKTHYVFHVVPQMGRASRIEDYSATATRSYVVVNCSMCDSRMALYDVREIIKFEAILTSQEPTREEPPTFDFNNIGEPFGI